MVTRVGFFDNNSNTATTCAVVVTGVSAGDTLVIGSRRSSATSTITSVTVSSNANATARGTEKTGGPGNCILAWYTLDNVATGGSLTVTVTLNEDIKHGIVVWHLSSADTAAAYDNSASGGATSTTPSWSLTTNSANAAIFVVLTSDTGEPAAGAAYTAEVVINHNFFDLGEYDIDAGAAGAKTVDFGTQGSGAWIGHAISIKNATGAALAPLITSQPANQAANAGSTAALSVAAQFTGTGPAYQWQDDRSGIFTNVADGTGGTTASYTTATLTQAHQGRRYRVLVSDSNGSTTSGVASVGVIGFKVYLFDTSVQAGADVWARDPTVAASHTTTGALVSDAATVAGTAVHLTLHATTGALVAGSATVAGTAAHQHVATGALVAQAATVAGTATHLTLHTSTGALVAGSATIAGAAAAQFTTSGALVSDAAVVAGSSAHLTLHTTTGALSADSATISGAAEHSAPGVHTATGALQAQSATMAGEASILALFNPPVAQEVTGGWPIYSGKIRRVRDVSTDVPRETVSIESVQENIEKARETLTKRQELRRLERKDRYVVEEIRRLLDEQDRLNMSVQALELQLRMASMDNDDIALILALAS